MLLTLLLCAAKQETPSSLNSLANLPEILILNSYHRDYTWTEQEMDGLLNVLKRAYPGISPYVEYMDWKYYPTQENLALLAQLYRYRYGGKPLDLVIATDNAALDFAIKWRAELFHDAPIVFCGLNGYSGTEHYPPRVTGVLQNIDPESTLNLALRLHPKTGEVVVVLDTTESGQGLKQEIQAVLPQFLSKAKFRFLDNMDLPEILKVLAALPPTSLVYYGIYNRDRSGAVYDHEQAAELISRASAVPVYHSLDWSLGHGVVGGYMLSGVKHGEQAGELALRVLKGESFERLPVVTRSICLPMFDYKVLRRFRIPLSKLPAGSTIINRPDPVFVRYRLRSWIIGGIALLFLALNLLLLGSTRRRRKAETDVKQGEQRFRELADLLPQPVYEANAEGTVTFVNKHAYAAFGYSPEDLARGTSVFEMVAERDRDRARYAWARALKGSSMPGTQFLVQRKDGTTFPAIVYTSPIYRGSQITGQRGVVLDISERVQSEEALRKSEENYRLLAETAHDVIAVHDMQGRIIYVNTAGQLLTGYTREELARKNIEALIVPEYRPAEMERARRRIAGEMGLFTFETEIIAKDGRVVPLEVSSMGIARSGQPAQILVVGRDISERRRSEETLRRLSAAVEQAAEAVAITSPEGRIEYVNPAMAAVAGMPSQEIAGRQIGGILSAGQDLPELLRLISKDGQPWTGRVSAVSDAGSLSELEASLAPIRTPLGEVSGFVMVARDVTREAQVEAQLRQAQKMEALGALAGGIAHEFNNLLFSIMGYAELVLADLQPQTEVHENLVHLLQSSQRARELVEQIMAFGQRTQPEAVSLNLAPILYDVERLLRASLPRGITIRFDAGAYSWNVSADPSEMHQVLMNLCTNAAQALGEGPGLLEVTLRDLQADADFAASHLGLKPGPYVELTVSDTGPALEPEVREHVFEPFYNRREGDAGSGLSLAVVHGIVTKLGGKVSVYSAPGEGNSFHAYLPALPPSEAALPDESTALRGRGRLLVVDDEADAVAILSQMLTGLGYEVTAYADSVEALHRFEADPQAFDLVITDQAMARITGRELAKRVHNARPELPVVLCTGFGQNMSAEFAGEAGIRAFLRKPFTKLDLARTVAAALGRQTAERQQSGG